MYVTRCPEASGPAATQFGGSVIQITFSRASLRLVFRVISEEASNETILFLAVLIALTVLGPCRSLDFIQRRQPSGAYRIPPDIAVRSRAPRCRSPKPSAGAASVAAITTTATY